MFIQRSASLLSTISYLIISSTLRNWYVRWYSESFFSEKCTHLYFSTISSKFFPLSGYKNKIIYRDLNKESEILSLLRALGFEASGDKFYLLLGDDYIFNFFKNEIDKLQEIGEVFYSENFKIIKHVNNKNIVGQIQAGKYDYLEFKFKISDISNDEIKGIILAFKDNLKYYKLKSGEYLDLEEIELRNFLKLLDVLSIDNEINDDKLLFNKNKSIFINEFITDNNLRYIKGKNELTKVKKKIKDVKKINFKEPVALNANL